MELNSPAASPTTTASTPETDTDTPPPKHFSTALSFPNGSLHPHSPPPPPVAVVVLYKECLKNHAASIGGHALDGCGEFMPLPTATPSDPTSLKCAACGCHRNFHRRDPDDPNTHLIEYHPYPYPYPYPYPCPKSISPPPISPPPISSSYYPSAPQMLLALSSGGGVPAKPEKLDRNTTATPTSNGGRKRYRTKFSQEQKEKMYSFSEKLGWKMQKRDEGLVEEFCSEVGVRRGVFKVWMHNNKHTFGKKDPQQQISATCIGIGIDNLSVSHNNNSNDVAAISFSS